jgi:arginine exporter protein ArgO
MRKILLCVILAVGVLVGLLIFSSIVDEVPRWVDKVVILGLLVLAGFGYHSDRQQMTRIRELEDKITKNG